MTIQGHAARYYFLPDSAFASEAIGHADVPSSLAGRARVLYELASGENPFPNEAPGTIKNPQGEIGHDHSGPPWGSAFLHPIATYSGKKDNSGFLQQTVGSQPVVNLSASSAAPSLGPWVIWNRPFADVPVPFGTTTANLAPYSRGLVRGIAHRTSASTVTLTVKLVTLDYLGRTLSSMSSNVSISSSTETMFSIDDAWFVLGPGRNIIRIDFSTGDAAAGISVDAIGVYQTVKRSH